MKSHYSAVAAATVLTLAACQKVAEPAPAPTSGAASAEAHAGAAAVVERLAAMPGMERCGEDWPGHAAPAPASQVVDLGGGSFAVLMNCQLGADRPITQTVHVQGPDGVLKYQPLLIYNGAGYDPDYTWEGTHSAPLTWDAATSQLVSVYKTAAMPAADGQDAVKASEATIRWRWAGDHFAMVSSTYAVQDAPGAPFVVNATWPGTPPIADPTSPLQPVT